MSEHFVYRLIPPRASFDQDMSAEEGAIMGRHAQYWQQMMAAGKVLIYGPVRDGTGAWGLGVLEVDSADEAHAIAVGDPAVTSGLASVEIGAMLRAFVR
jgi:uncharacterized protein YciI